MNVSGNTIKPTEILRWSSASSGLYHYFHVRRRPTFGNILKGSRTIKLTAGMAIKRISSLQAAVTALVKKFYQSRGVVIMGVLVPTDILHDRIMDVPICIVPHQTR